MRVVADGRLYSPARRRTGVWGDTRWAAHWGLASAMGRLMDFPKCVNHHFLSGLGQRNDAEVRTATTDSTRVYKK